MVEAEGLRLRLYAGRGEKVALAHIKAYELAPPARPLDALVLYCTLSPRASVQRQRAAASPPMRPATESPPPPPVQTSPPVGRGLAASRPTGTALGAALAPLRVGCAVAPATLPGVEARGVVLRRDASRRQQSGRCVQLNQEHGEDTARFEEHSGRVE